MFFFLYICVKEAGLVHWSKVEPLIVLAWTEIREVIVLVWFVLIKLHDSRVRGRSWELEASG